MVFWPKSIASAADKWEELTTYENPTLPSPLRHPFICLYPYDGSGAFVRADSEYVTESRGEILEQYAHETGELCNNSMRLRMGDLLGLAYNTGQL